MDARGSGYGYLVPIPRFGSSHLGLIVHIDDDGVARSMGKLCDDDYFKQLLGPQVSSEPNSTVEEYLGSTAAFTTGCWELKAFSKEEVAASVILTDDVFPRPTNRKTICGWRFSQGSGKHGLGDAIILGPCIRRARSELDRILVERWAKKAPYKSSLFSNRIIRRYPKLLIVLEEWITPSWAYVYTDSHDNDPGSCALGLAASETDVSPQWDFVALPNENLTAPMRWGNTGDKEDWVVAIHGIPVYPNPRSLKSIYRQFRSATSNVIPTKRVPDVLSRVISKFRWPDFFHVTSKVRLPEKVIALSKIRLRRRKRDLGNLGKVVSFALQLVEEPTEDPDIAEVFPGSGERSRDPVNHNPVGSESGHQEPTDSEAVDG